ncbi:peroxiredoxin [Lysobacter sp. GX 14042]|uniref:peroxiredoxin n=1 Tax=Lysobacter sp. GX 14042 TaxID=2907155 RepID=UPI001F466A6B|nr:peroxiredoxin [Lysobacter sp. GX 14042]MCE7032946.1 peroxiredoxin [Lysobacter sp. GX 14042]
MNILKSLAAALALTFAAACAQPASAALKPGDPAPDFSAPGWLAGEAFQFSLADALRGGPVVVYFFPAANTPGCNLEASLFSQNIDAFRGKGATVIGVTAGNIDQLRAFSNDTATCAGKFPVAADEGAAIAADYDAVTGSGDMSSRTSYVIAQDGTIAAVHSDMNPARHVQAMLDGLDP